MCALLLIYIIVIIIFIFIIIIIYFNEDNEHSAIQHGEIIYTDRWKASNNNNN